MAANENSGRLAGATGAKAKLLAVREFGYPSGSADTTALYPAAAAVIRAERIRLV